MKAKFYLIYRVAKRKVIDKVTAIITRLAFWPTLCIVGALVTDLDSDKL